jgi:hypothetical protein
LATTNEGRGSRQKQRAVKVAVSALRDIRRALTVEGDVASDIAFQNDVNALLAAVARLATPEPEERMLPGLVLRDQVLETGSGRRARTGGRR